MDQGPSFRTPQLSGRGSPICCFASICASIICLSQPTNVFGNPQLHSGFALQNEAPLQNFNRLQPAQLGGAENTRYQPDYTAIQFPDTRIDRDSPSLAGPASQPKSGAMEFAWSMLKNHVMQQQSNSALCPILPQTLLASLYDAADSDAKAELRATLQATSQELQPMIQNQLLATNRSAVNSLDYAMVYFLGKDTKIRNEIYRKALDDGVSFQTIDFRNRNEAANIANRWVSEKTRGVIREIVAPATLDPSTRLVMASVIYFKGKWKYQFTKTEPAFFEYGPTAQRGQSGQQVPMMYQYNKLRYGEINSRTGSGIRWVELPYEGTNGLSMLLILPKVRHQLQRSVDDLSLADMNDVIEQLKVPRATTKVHLQVPRFNVYSSASLVPVLKSLGLRAIFDRASALDGLSNEQLVVRDVTQRTFISVDEQGTTATSVAALSFVALSAAPPPPTVNFTVDEPFLAMIVDKIHSYPMFVAKVVAPETFSY